MKTWGKAAALGTRKTKAKMKNIQIAEIKQLLVVYNLTIDTIFLCK